MQVAKMISSDAAATAEAEASRHGMTSRPYEMVRQLGSCNAVVVFSARGCPMCTVAERLLFSLGVGPTIVELDRHVEGPDIREVLRELADGQGQQQPVPAVFIGGKFLGGVEALMACHINGNLVPLLKHSGALWL
ncbi:glutaredoxin-C9-like [Rosa sericea]